MTTDDLSTRLDRAIRLNAEGKLVGAERECRAILDLSPDHRVATHLLAVVLCRGGRLVEGEGLLRWLTATNPMDPEPWRHLADALHAQGKLADSIQVLRRLVALAPRDALALMALGVSLQDSGQVADAIEAYAQALCMDGALPKGYFNLGTALHRAGQLEEAVVAYLRALDQAPDDANITLNLGNTLTDLGRHEEAELAYRHALERQPEWPEALTNTGLAAQNLGRPEEALALHRQAVAEDPTYGPAWTNMGGALQRLGRMGDALVAYEKAVALQPNDAGALSNLAQALDDIGDADHAALLLREAEAGDGALFGLERAEALGRQAVAADPGNADAWTNLGGVLDRLGRGEEALAAFRTAATLAPATAHALPNLAMGLESAGLVEDALTLHRQAVAANPDSGIAHFNMGVALLRRGQYQEGWREYEWRWRGGVANLRPRFTEPQWDGGDLSGRTLLVHAEQGFGDTLQFVRFLGRAAACGGRVILEVQPALHALLADVAGADLVVAAGQDLPPFDVHLPLMSLPGVLDVPPEEYGAGVPYLRASAAALDKWRPRLAGNGRKVGLAWSGNPKHKRDRQRSVPAAVLLERLEGAPVQLFSLQKDVRDADMAALAAHAITPLGADLADFVDTAAVVAQLDLVITVDTAVAHLAGALGRPTWVLLPFTPDWRWLRGREDSLWYPGMRLFRQSVAGGWDEVVDRVARELTPGS